MYLSRFLKKINKNKEKIKKEIDDIRKEIDIVKSLYDLPQGMIEGFSKDRNSEFYKKNFSCESPLVSVCVATFNRSQVLVDRCINSILNQTYKNLQIVIIGDFCTDDTEKKISTIRDSRICFENLPQRGSYPEENELRWMVAGTPAVNRALELSEGLFVTHLDDDDVHDPERIEKLLMFVQDRQLDIAWHPFWSETPAGEWTLKECPSFKMGHVTTSSIFYHSWFRKIPWDINAYRYREPGDWNRLRKFAYLGVNAARYPEPLLWHYKEKTQLGK